MSLKNCEDTYEAAWMISQVHWLGPNRQDDMVLAIWGISGQGQTQGGAQAGACLSE